MNVVTTQTGKVRAVCYHCGKRSRPVEPDEQGRIPFGEITWSCAPYSPGFEHRDGSTGDLWFCPACDRTPLPRSPHPDRAAALAEREAVRADPR